MTNEPEPLDDAWRDIVDHYGERAELPPEVTSRAHPPSPPASAQTPDPVLETDPLGEVFVAPVPPPQRLPEPRRLLAWIGVLVIPVALIACVLASLTLPTWTVGFAVAWFVGGFLYLVATMDPGRRHDDPDDGAVV